MFVSTINFFSLQCTDARRQWPWISRLIGRQLQKIFLQQFCLLVISRSDLCLMCLRQIKKFFVLSGIESKVLHYP